MGAEDHAILIGISRYPELGEGGQSADLQGPGNDVDAVRAWLLDPKGGGFPNDGNIHVIKSSAATSAADAHPTADELELALSTLDGVAQANKQAGRGMRVGRRLYLFMSGHGFSPARQRGCLFSANAKERMSFNVHATGWLNWLQDSGYFSEFVLWMDCCMNRMSFLQPRDPPLPPVNASTPPRANFVAFAAQRPLKALELPIPEDGGRIHGVFTWALLEGLRGAAADSNARVTGRSLADWIRNAQSARMPPELTDPDVAREPEVIQEDAALIFARGIVKPSYPVDISFPAAAVGSTARLWSGSPPRIARQFPVTGVPENLRLLPGLYLIDVPGAGLRQGFEVLRPTDVLIEEQGAAVSDIAEGSLFQLDVDPDDPTAEIFVVDHQFQLADNGSARLSTDLPSGLFKIKTRIGRGVKQRVILLDRDRPPIDRASIVQPVATVVPIPATAATHEYHERGLGEALSAAHALGVAPDGATLMVMARAFSSRDSPIVGTRPWDGVSIVDADGQIVLDLERDGQLRPGGDPYAFAVKEVNPGAYFLRQRADDGTTIEQSLITCKSWRLEVYVLRRVEPGTGAVDGRQRLSVMMRGLNRWLDPEVEDRLIETARVALADERRILNAELESLLMQKFENPLAGIIGGHLLLIERERNPARDLSLLDTVVRNLQRLVGPDHPDVAALALHCADSKLRRTVKDLVGPPMFQRSWRMLVQAAWKRPNLIPAAMWQRVQALTALPPFLVWAADDEVKSAASADLARAVFGEIKAAEAAVFSVADGDPQKALMLAKGKVPRVVKPPAGAVVGIEAREITRSANARAVRLGLPPSAIDVIQARVR